MTAPELTLDGSLFVVTPMTAMRSFVLQPRLAPVLAEAGALFYALLGGLARSQGAESQEDVKLDVGALLDADLDVNAIAAGMGRICAKLPPGELQAITRELLAGATMDGVQLFAAVQGDGDPFDIRMRGRTLDVWRLLWHALRVNYPDFFMALGGSGKPRPGANPSAASSTSGTSGQSTGS